MRSHRVIENSLHRVLDVTMREDELRNRKGDGLRNLAALRRIAPNLARAQSDEDSMRGKIKRTGLRRRLPA